MTAERARSAVTASKLSTLVWFSLCLHGRMGKTMATRPARRGPRCQLVGRRRSPLILWYTGLVAEVSRTCGFPYLMRSRRRRGFPSSCTARRRKQQPRCDVLFLAHGNGGKPRIRLARPLQPGYGDAGFDIVPDPTIRFPNHARLIHPQGVAGFTDEHLVTLAATFRDTVGC